MSARKGTEGSTHQDLTRGELFNNLNGHMCNHRSERLSESEQVRHFALQLLPPCLSQVSHLGSVLLEHTLPRMSFAASRTFPKGSPLPLCCNSRRRAQTGRDVRDATSSGRIALWQHMHLCNGLRRRFAVMRPALDISIRPVTSVMLPNGPSSTGGRTTAMTSQSVKNWRIAGRAMFVRDDTYKRLAEQT